MLIKIRYVVKVLTENLLNQIFYNSSTIKLPKIFKKNSKQFIVGPYYLINSTSTRADEEPRDLLRTLLGDLVPSKGSSEEEMCRSSGDDRCEEKAKWWDAIFGEARDLSSSAANVSLPPFDYVPEHDDHSCLCTRNQASVEYDYYRDYMRRKTKWSIVFRIKKMTDLDGFHLSSSHRNWLKS